MPSEYKTNTYTVVTDHQFLEMISAAFGLIAVLGWSPTVIRLSRCARIPDVSSNVWLPNAELLLDVPGLGGILPWTPYFRHEVDAITGTMANSQELAHLPALPGPDKTGRVAYRGFRCNRDSAPL